MINARDIKKTIERMAADGKSRVAILEKVISMGVQAEWAEFMVATYARKFNK